MERDDGPLPIHRTTVEVSPPIPGEIDVATDVCLTIRVFCPEGCDFRGAPVSIVGDGGVLAAFALDTWEDTVNRTSAVVFTAPETPGRHAWSIVFARHQSDECIHDESVAPLVFETKAHATSMSVWGVPSPAVIERPFVVHVGVKCSVECPLADRRVEIRDASGATVGEGRLGEAPWPGTDALYWVAVQVIAPSTAGVFTWSAVFPRLDLLPPHDETAAAFSFRAAPPPQATVSVQVVARETGLPIEDVEVRLDAYEAFTDGNGLGTMAVPHGAYVLTIRKDGYTVSPLDVRVTGNVAVRVGATSAPTKAELEDMMRRFEGESSR